MRRFETLTRRRISWLKLESVSRKCNLNDIPNVLTRKNRGVEVDTANEHREFHNIHAAYDYLVALLKEVSE